MPPEAVQPSTNSDTGKPNSFWKLILITMAAIFLVLFAYLIYLLLANQNQPPANRVVTGLNAPQVKIGINGFSGIYPNNENPPASDDVQVNDVIFDTLVKLRGEQVIPSLATSWTNPDQNTWRFTIRDGVKFTSGDPLTVDDVKYSFDQAIASAANPNTAWSSSTEVENIKNVKIVDTHTIDIVTTKPDPIFLLKMLDLYILSKAQTNRDGVTHAVGTGPYKVTSFLKDKEVGLETNNSYWSVPPKVKKVIYLIYKTDSSMQTALSQGKIDIGRLRSAKTILPSGFSKKTFDEPRVLSLMFNFANKTAKAGPNPLLKKDVREALKLAIDQHQVIKDASASGRPASQVITKSIFGYNPDLTYPKRDLNKAKSLLEANGISNLKITIYTTFDKKLAAESIASQLAAIGVAAKVETQSDFGTLVKKITSGEGQAFVASVLVNDGGEYLSSILSTNGEQNILGYSNPNLDKIIAQADNSFVPKERKTLLQQAMAIAMADDPILPMYSQTDTFLVRDNFDLTLNSIGEMHADTISGRAVQTIY